MKRSTALTSGAFGLLQLDGEIEGGNQFQCDGCEDATVAEERAQEQAGQLAQQPQKTGDIQGKSGAQGQHAEADLADLAGEKMKEINAAYGRPCS